MTGFELAETEDADDEVIDARRSPVRQLMVVLLDTSWSMGQREEGSDAPPPIVELNTRLHELIKKGGIQTSGFATKGELAMAAFWSDDSTAHVDWLPIGVPVHDGLHPSSGQWEETGHQFHWAARIQPFSGRLPAQGGTPIGAAICAGLNAIERRRSELPGVAMATRPVMVLLTDGKPTDRVAEAIRRVHQAEDDDDLAFWIAGMQGARRETMEQIADKGNYIELGARPVSLFMTLLTMSPRAAGNGRTARDIYANLNAKLNKMRVATR